ncbi:8273_t:CDS:2 [Funneliformis mosseae]|uniref:8273_t:CDS:1 n=1 Tax=Funneliformis mosseae TaxID=27381 RepID=A0A9N9CYX4_FUNMO|nr:8273_t:CDS:2 [Funneliformis mosseae]
MRFFGFWMQNGKSPKFHPTTSTQFIYIYDQCLEHHTLLKPSYQFGILTLR